MKAIFARATDGQIVIKVIVTDSNDSLLLEEWQKDTGTKAWVVEQGDGSVLLYPSQPQ